MPQHADTEPRGTCRIILLVLWVLFWPSHTAAEQGSTSHKVMLKDAQLADVCFVDKNHGWAVGDRGVLWHTRDGGRHWTLQLSGVDCPLKSVHFIDPNTGWVVGGWTHPYTHTSTGVVLRTRDGGLHWFHEKKLLLPALKHVEFFDASRGWTIGRRSALFPSGVFTTKNGGRSWSPLPNANARRWMTGDFVDPLTGALAGDRGFLTTVQRRRFEPSRTPNVGLRKIHRLELTTDRRGWLVGSGALVLRTDDLGHTWHTPPAPLPEGMSETFDFAALAVHEESCWIAGSPGTRILHSRDRGRSWMVFDTGQRLPIRGLTFIDSHRGWAVGALGTILETHDGGRSWRRQLSGGTRAAFVGFYSDPDKIPLELLAKLSANDGYLGIINILNRRDVDLEADLEAAGTNNDIKSVADLQDRTREITIAAGASGAETAWNFPLRQKGLSASSKQHIDLWNRANDGRGIERLEAYLVRQIRLWRPEIIFTHDANPQGDRPLSHLISQLVLRAADKAADPTRMEKQMTHAGLEPWKVKKIFGTMPPGQMGSLNVTTAQLAPRLGCSFSSYASRARGLLLENYSIGEQTAGFRMLVNHTSNELGRRDFFSGIVLQTGGEARRILSEATREDIATLRRLAQHRRNLQKIFDRDKENPLAGSKWLAQAAELTRQLDKTAAAEILYQLAQRYHQSGRWEMAAEAYDLVARRYPEHPLSTSALVWLVQYYSSTEAAWRMRPKHRFAVQQTAAFALTGRTADPAAAHTGGQSAESSVPRTQELVKSGPNLNPGLNPNLIQRADRAAQIGKFLQGTKPDLFAEPMVCFPLATAYRNRGFPTQAQRIYMTLRRGPRDTWRTCAEAEHWLSEAKGIAPKSIWTCVRAASKPRLDGKLDDAVWKQAPTIKLRSASRDDAEWPAEARLAYDDEFLYIAIKCRKARGVKYPESTATRPRDPDLSKHDRVDLFLDLDRDYRTFYRLSVDHRGWTGEACWGDRTWNPQWYVASATSAGAWTAEAAISLAELTGEKPKSKHVWAVGIQRTVPGVGFQSWSRPAATQVLGQGFGFLIFQ